MRIGIISNLYPPFTRGGAEHVVVRTVDALHDDHHDIFVITSGPKKALVSLQEDPIASERVYRFYPKNLYFSLDDHKYPWIIRLFWHIIDAFSWYSYRETLHILQNTRPDVVMTHNLKGIGLRIARAVQKRNIPHVHVVHDLQLIYPSGLLFAGKEHEPFFVKPFYAIYRAICRKRFGSPDLVIFPSEYLKKVYMAHNFFPESEVIVMPNPAPKFVAVPRSHRAGGKMRLLFVGQLEMHKGIDFLIDALRSSDLDFTLIIAGEGTYAEKVKKIAEKDKRFVYLGYVSLDQLVNCFSVADALVVPSLCYENSPTVIYESFNAGVPVVASDIGGVGELVEDGKNGFLFPPGSREALLQALKKIDEQKEVFFASQTRIQETISPHKISRYSKRLIEQLEQVIARHDDR